MNRRVHFVGAGGIGMSGLAEVLLNLGYDVSGSDLSASPITARLETYGLRFTEGHDAQNVAGAEIVVVSAAVPVDNPEIVEARRRGIPVIHRSDLLADLIRLKPNAVVVGGTHGKTTTTSMISAILDHANIGATSLIGGILHRSGTNARWGTGEYIVAEADEHDGSFLRLHPTIGVVTNIDEEHLEHYGTLDNIKRAFIDFCNQIPFYGYSIVCHDDEQARSILPSLECVTVTYGLEEGAGIVGRNARLSGAAPGQPLASQLDRLSTRIDVENRDSRFGKIGPIGTFEVRALGLGNARNALAACAVGMCLGMRFGLIADGLREFDGVRRRMQVRGEARGVTVIEDYAHHPTEIANTLEAVRWVNPKRIVSVFQPHLYTRTKFLAKEFAQVLSTADRAIVTDIYGSREAPMPGVDSGLIVDAARALGSGRVELVNDMRAVPEHIAPDLREGDVVLVLGAGDINRIVEPLLQQLGQS
ncbi:MAG: UDP-N-acetylmuramate--L-alanine ligase [Candidatus Hydrogenedentota bacterium]